MEKESEHILDTRLPEDAEFPSSLREEPASPRELGPSTPEEDELIAKLEAENLKLDMEMGERYGEGFMEQMTERMGNWLETMTKKGEGYVAWAESRGVPLPKSKMGLRVLSGVTGSIGAVTPGGAPLLALAYIFWKRSNAFGASKNFTEAVTRTRYA